MLLLFVTPDVIFLMVHYLEHLLFFDSIDFVNPKMYKSSQIYEAFNKNTRSCGTSTRSGNKSSTTLLH